MMKALTLFSLLLAGGVTVTSALTAQEVGDEVELLQSSRPAVLNQGVFADSTSYQSKAKQSAIDNLANVAGYQKFQVRQYYVLACLYHATNGEGNPRYDAIEPGTIPPPWTNEEFWLIEPNYCLWFGIQCFNSLDDEVTQNNQEAQLKVIEIDLAQNALAGTFPNEIALLSADLLVIDVFDNFFHWVIDYRWMSAMINLEALYFGRTSWDADGIPINLRFMTKLQELDFSNSFWRGTLTENAFNNLKQLFYLDMGRSFLNLENLATIPDYISGLPLLRFLFVDNIKPTDPNAITTTSLSLSFLLRMTNLEVMWMDYTNVISNIPEEIGVLKNLRSLSLVYCKLTGIIPASIINTAMQELWLYGNPNLGGTLPFGTLDLRRVYIEGTGITGIPKGVCDQVGTDEAQDLLELGADCEICPVGCCTCCGDECNNLRTPTPAPTNEEDADKPPPFCFSGSSHVEVEHKGLTKMSNLELGDSIKVADNKFEPVYSFGHKNELEKGAFLAIHAAGNRKLEISEDHMLAMEGGRVVPASMVQIGDKLLTASGDLAEVHTVRTVKRTGVYAPFTESGSLIVNDIVASNYVAFQGAEKVQVAGIEIPLNYHWMAHIFNSVHRMAYKMGFATTETYTENGTSTWVAGPHEMGLWLLDQNALVMVAGLLGYVLIFGLASIVESLINSPMALASVVVGGLTGVAARRFVSLKMTKKM